MMLIITIIVSTNVYELNLILLSCILRDISTIIFTGRVPTVLRSIYLSLYLLTTNCVNNT